VCFATRNTVVGLDVDEQKLRKLSEGKTGFTEQGLDRLLNSGIKSGRLSFSSDYDQIAGAKIIFLTVGTPSTPSGGIDLTQVKSAVRSLAPVITESKRYQLVVVKSTVVPGTTRDVVTNSLERLTKKRAGADFGVCNNPEFLREGSAIRDTFSPDRIVIGSDEPRSAHILSRFYRRFYAKPPPILETGLETSELVKYASNAFLATKISFINLIARLCEMLPDSDVDVVARCMGIDPRVGLDFLEAGPGFGGSCFPKDVRALATYARHLGTDVSLLRAVERINETQAEHVLSLVEGNHQGLRGKSVAVLGVAFKPGTGDVRESRAIKIIEALLMKSAVVRVYDPSGHEEARKILAERVRYCSSSRECIQGADLAIVVNADPEFKGLKPEDFRKLMRNPEVLDTRRIFDAGKFNGKVPIHYVGRGPRSN